MNYCGGLSDAKSAESLLEDLADLFERAAADGTPIREIVGEDPVEFVEALVQNYEPGEMVQVMVSDTGCEKVKPLGWKS